MCDWGMEKSYINSTLLSSFFSPTYTDGAQDVKPQLSIFALAKRQLNTAVRTGRVWGGTQGSSYMIWAYMIIVNARFSFV